MNTLSPDAMTKLLAPRSVAVVGASERNFYGRRVLRNLREHGFAGEIYAVNPRAAEVDGIASYPSLRDTPPVDVAVVVTPAKAVPGIAADAAAAGVTGMVVLSTGFGEAGDDGRALEDALLTAARDAGIVVVGPNTIGAYGVGSGFCAIGAPMPWDVRPGPVGLVMQSGGLMVGSLAALAEAGVGVAAAVSVGNAHGTDAADWIAALARDPEVEVIGLLLETLPEWGRFRAAVDLARREGKRLYAVKVGKSEQGRQAAATHTGALAGDHRVVADLLAQLDIREARTLDGLLLALQLESAAGPPRGTNVGVVAASGGAVGNFADLAEAHGVRLDPFAPGTQDALLAAIGTAANPLDVGGQALSDPGLLSKTLDTVLTDEQVAVGAYLPSLGLPGTELVEHRGQLSIVASAAQARRIPVIATQLTHSPGTASVLQWRSEHPMLVVSPSADAALDGLAAWLRQPPAAVAEPLVSASADLASEWEIKQLLREAGLPVPAATVFEPAGEVPEIDRFPVVAKGMSPGVLHKSAAGLVVLPIDDAAGLIAARDRLVGTAAAAGLDLTAILVEELASEGTDLFVSITRQPMGTVLALGRGGTDVEERNAVRFLGVPADRTEIEHALRSLGLTGEERLHVLLDGLLEFFAGHDWSTLELNPVRLHPGGASVLDAVAIP